MSTPEEFTDQIQKWYPGSRWNICGDNRKLKQSCTCDFWILCLHGQAKYIPLRKKGYCFTPEAGRNTARPEVGRCQSSSLKQEKAMLGPGNSTKSLMYTYSTSYCLYCRRSQVFGDFCLFFFCMTFKVAFLGAADFEMAQWQRRQLTPFFFFHRKLHHR